MVHYWPGAHTSTFPTQVSAALGTYSLLWIAQPLNSTPVVKQVVQPLPSMCSQILPIAYLGLWEAFMSHQNFCRGVAEGGFKKGAACFVTRFLHLGYTLVPALYIFKASTMVAFRCQIYGTKVQYLICCSAAGSLAAFCKCVCLNGLLQ